MSATEAPREWLSTGQAAERIGVSADTLRAMVSAENGPPAYRIGQQLRFRGDELDSWIASRRVQPEREAS